MFSYGRATEEANLDPLSPASYCAKIRAAHALADLLKRTRPHLFDQVSEHQATINRCQQTLDKSKDQVLQALAAARREGTAPPVLPALSDEAAAALKELDDTTQALLDLRHKGQMAR